LNWIRFALFLLIALGLGQIITPTHPDSSYLRARYAQNLIDGEGFVYNPGDDTLLTSAPLMVIIHAATALPSGDITGPPVMLNLVVLAFGAFFLTQILLREKARIEIAFAVALIWLAGGFITFGGVETWLATFSLCTFYFADDRPRLAGFVAGLMLLIAPLALIFVLMLGATSERKFWLLAPLPALMWYAFAFFTLDMDGLTLASAPGEGFAGVVSLLILVPVVFLLMTARSYHPLALWGLAYSLAAVVFHLTSDAMMLISAGVILAVVVAPPPPPPKTLDRGAEPPKKLIKKE
jgi:hypothetical protein